MVYAFLVFFHTTQQSVKYLMITKWTKFNQRKKHQKSLMNISTNFSNLQKITKYLG